MWLPSRHTGRDPAIQMPSHSSEMTSSYAESSFALGEACNNDNPLARWIMKDLHPIKAKTV